MWIVVLPHRSVRYRPIVICVMITPLSEFSLKKVQAFVCSCNLQLKRDY